VVGTDWEGYHRWVDRTSGRVVVDPPYPAPQGWLDRFGWRIDRAQVEALATSTGDRTTFLCGAVENEEEVLDLFDLVVCLVIDDEPLRHRLLTRTTNPFGKHPKEMAAALGHNGAVEPTCRRLGAKIVDGRRPLEEVADVILTAAGGLHSTGGR
jgi:hypothetical protein